MLSVFDLFTIGIGPSSSHTVGPMRAALMFAEDLSSLGETAGAVRVELFGSLGLTGHGHGVDKAILGGLEGQTPEQADPAGLEDRLAVIRTTNELRILGRQALPFDGDRDMVFHREEELPLHPNGMRFTAFQADGREILMQEYYSTGGGVVVASHAPVASPHEREDAAAPYPFSSAADLLEHCRRHGLSISRLAMENEKAWRPEEEVRERLTKVWAAMQDCLQRGCMHEGILPGGLQMRRRAPQLLRKLITNSQQTAWQPLAVLDWVNLYAIAVSEENAAGGRVVTAPTNGSAGIVPAVLQYYVRFCPGATDENIARFLLTAGAVGILYRQNASISGAEVGCQGEVGVACSMAAAGLTEVLGGTPAQVENAAEIAMEHNLGLTCDPVGGMVQIPCIERNAMGATKAISASQLALHGDGSHAISLDTVIRTMLQTGADMCKKYKETSLGGLAVSLPNC